MKKYSLGVDTGGTYTDAVIVEMNSGTIVVKEKSLTTKGNLSIGVSNALSAVMLRFRADAPDGRITQVSLSTTLCTNALVEGHGGSVAVFLIGFNQKMIEETSLLTVVPEENIYSIAGGHNYLGEQLTPLNTSVIEKTLTTLQVDAYAVAAHYSVRNRQHELQTKQLIQQHVNKPVSISSELSIALGAPKRALTAALNARIISLIVNLEDAVLKVMKQLKIDAPLMIVKGDGSVGLVTHVRERPIETILSGPAATVIGAGYLCGLNDFVVTDMGGTTTDIATVIDGLPNLNKLGAKIGGYRTLVKAIDMRTLGLGGDSEVDLSTEKKIIIKRNRVIPISLLVHLWPQVLQSLEAALLSSGGMQTALTYVMLPLNSEKIDSSKIDGLNSIDKQFYDQIPQGHPVSLLQLMKRSSDRARLQKLLKRNLVQISGLTPSDVAHVLGKQEQWNVEAATIGCELLGRASGFVRGNRYTKPQENQQQVKQFAQLIMDAVINESAHLLLEELSGCEWDRHSPLVQALTQSMGSNNTEIGRLDIQFNSKLPIVGVGGPAHIYYPPVGKKLGSEMIIPQHAEVANAIGAAVSRIRTSAVVEINCSDKGYVIHSQREPLHIKKLKICLEKAEQLAKQQLLEDYKKQSNYQATIQQLDGSLKIDTRIDRIEIPGVEGDEAFISATVICSIK